MIAHDEDEQHSTKVDFHAIEESKQEQQGPGNYVQSLLDMDSDTRVRKICDNFKQLDLVSEMDGPSLPLYEPEQLTELYEQLALYRIRGYKLFVEQQLDELDDANLKRDYPSQVLYENGYFEHYEESLDWYFDPDLLKCSDLDNYQRLVLRNHIGVGEYRNWDSYHSYHYNHLQDQAYVNYCAELTNNTKWIEDYMTRNKYQWRKIQDVVHLQAVEIAAVSRTVSGILVEKAYKERLWSVNFDYRNYKDMDDVYFEIWKRVAQQKKDFRVVLTDLLEEKLFPSCRAKIREELENSRFRFYMKKNYDAHLARIDDTVSENDARQLIRDAIKEMIPKPKVYLDYAKKKLEIAKAIKLI